MATNKCFVKKKTVCTYSKKVVCRIVILFYSSATDEITHGNSKYAKKGRWTGRGLSAKSFECPVLVTAMVFAKPKLEGNLSQT